MGRPKNKIERKNINTKLDPEIIEILRIASDETNIPQNRLIEIAVREKYGHLLESDKENISNS